MHVCARCRRPLTREPIVIGGHGFGPRCAQMVGDLLTQLVRKSVVTRKPRRRSGAERQLDLLEVQA